MSLLFYIYAHEIEMENIGSEDIGNKKPLVSEGSLDQELMVESSTDDKAALSLTAEDHICMYIKCNQCSKIFRKRNI